jgi:hypothetical protein
MLAKVFIVLVAVTGIAAGGYIFWDDLVGNCPSHNQVASNPDSSCPSSCASEAESPCCASLARGSLCTGDADATTESFEIAPAPREVAAVE